MILVGLVRDIGPNGEQDGLGLRNGGKSSNKFKDGDFDPTTTQSQVDDSLDKAQSLA